MENIKYSIIIPHFNRSELIIKNLKQWRKLSDCEIIIVDDCSAKEQIDNIKSYVNNNEKKNITLFESKKKLYLSSARNKGISLAQGKWIFFIDDDDEPTNQFINFLSTTKLDESIFFYRFPYLKTSGKKVKNIFYESKFYSFQISTYLINRQFLLEQKILFEDGLIYEDIIFSMKIYDRVKNVKRETKYIKNIYSIVYNDNSNIYSILRSKKETPIDYIKVLNNIKETNCSDKNLYSLFAFIGFKNEYSKKRYTNTNLSKKMMKEEWKKLEKKHRNFLKLNWFNYFRILFFQIWISTIKYKKQ